MRNIYHQKIQPSALWSRYIHTPECLANHREFRFRDELANEFKKALRLDNGNSIIEIGCGPGVLCQKLKQWYHTFYVCGFDRDTAFIEYAKKQYPSIDFFVADANEFTVNDKFDYTISHTVFEYMNTNCFFNINKNLLRNGGEMVIISNLHQIYLADDLLHPMIPLLNKYYSQVEKTTIDLEKIICPQHYEEKDIAILFKEHDFEITNIHYLTNEIIPGNYPYAEQQKIINMYKTVQKSMFYTFVNKHGQISKSIYKKILSEIDEFYEQYLNTIKVNWPVNVDILRIVKAKYIGECT